MNDLQGGGEGVKTKLLSTQCERSGELSQGKCEVFEEKKLSQGKCEIHVKKKYRKVNVKYLQRKTIAR